MALDRKVSVRYDEGRYEFVLNTDFQIPGIPEFEASGSSLSDAFQSLAEYLEEAGA
jgi:hypothetical protein